MVDAQTDGQDSEDVEEDDAEECGLDRARDGLVRLCRLPGCNRN